MKSANANEPTASLPRRCSECGSELPASPAPDLCPKCLLLAGVRTEPLPAEAETAVKRDGRLASRGRMLWRSFLASLPFLVLPAITIFTTLESKHLHKIVVPLALLAAITLVSLLLPHRSLQDRLAGTFLVPR